MRRWIAGLNALAATLTLAGMVASSAAAESCAGAQLSACRGYELVSPADKSAGMVTFPTAIPPFQAGPKSITFASEEGDAVSYVSFSPFADPTGGVVSSYRARRTDGGWQSSMWSPAPVAPHPDLNNIVRMIGATPDFKTGYIDTDEPFDPADAAEEGTSPASLTDVYARNEDGTTTWISRPNGSAVSATSRASIFAGVSRDGSKVYFESEDAEMPKAAGQVAGSSLYVRAGGVTSPVSADATGEPVSSCGSVLASHNVEAGGASGNANTALTSGARTTTKNAISPDGSRVYFTAPDPYAVSVSSDPACQAPPQLYLRDGDDVIHVSATQRTVPDTPKGAYFQGASADGSKVYFTSKEALVDEATPGDIIMLYQYDVSSRQLQLVNPPSDTLTVTGVAEVSADGRAAYYLNVDGDLYAAVDGQVRLVAPVAKDPADSSIALLGSDRSIRLSADGHEALFASRRDLTGFQSGGASQLYLYSYDAATLSCISCNAVGKPPLGDAGMRYDAAASALMGDPFSRNLSSDGKTAYFNTKDELVAADDNNAQDVYEWHDGVVTLISDGRNATGSYLVDVAGDGRDVFFSTSAKLVSQDYDNGDLDIYDARVGGGFGSPSPPVSCAEDQCQGAPRSAPSLDAVSTTDFDAGPEEPAAVRPAVSVGALSASARSAFAKSGKTTLKVKVTTAGTAKVVVTGRVGGKSVTVAQASRKATKAGTLSLSLSLSKVARRELARKHALRLTIKTTFTGAASRSATLTLGSPTAKKR